MNIQTKHAITGTIVILVILAIFSLFSKKQEPEKPEIQPIPQPVQTVKCPDVTETKNWFQTLMKKTSQWQKDNGPYFFTAKRMAADPWINYQTVLDTEPHDGIEGIINYNNSESCDPEVLYDKQTDWELWHIQLMYTLKEMKQAYPKTKVK